MFLILLFFQITCSYSEILNVNSLLLWNPSREQYEAGTTLSITSSPDAIWQDVNGKIKVNAEGYANTPNIGNVHN